MQQDPAKPAWIGYPQRAGKIGKKYFSIVKLTGILHDKICASVLSEFQRMQTAGDRAGAGAVPRAQLREPGEEAF